MNALEPLIRPMRRLRLLDAYCGEGGAGAGYQRAGFHVTGIDINPAKGKRYPGEVFVQGDAVDYITWHGAEFDAIHASPPCQAYSVASIGTPGVIRPHLVEPTRAALIASGVPYIIENVNRAPLLNPVMLCGTMFDLTAYDPHIQKTLYLQRHRMFEASFTIVPPGGCRCRHMRDLGYVCGGVYGGGRSQRKETKGVGRGGYTPLVPVRRELMGMDWGTQGGLSEAIPPAYTERIGRQVAALLRRHPGRDATPLRIRGGQHGMGH